MDKIINDFSNINILDKNKIIYSYSEKIRAEFARKYTAGRQSVLLGLSEDAYKSKHLYKYFDLYDANITINNDNKLNNLISINDHSSNKQKVVILGNSFTENVSPFFIHTFNKVLKLRCNNKDGNNLKLSRWKKEILEFKPDIMIIIIESEYSHRLQDLKD